MQILRDWEQDHNFLIAQLYLFQFQVALKNKWKNRNARKTLKLFCLSVFEGYYWIVYVDIDL